MFLTITLHQAEWCISPSPRPCGTRGRGDPFTKKWGPCRGGQGAYGGLWVQNIIQAISRDLLVAAMRRIESAGYAVTLSVHDEIVTEVDEGFGNVEEFKQIMTWQPSWASGLPIAAKAAKPKVRLNASRDVPQTSHGQVCQRSARLMLP
jgi:DNA polymerase